MKAKHLDALPSADLKGPFALQRIQLSCILAATNSYLFEETLE